ncbi:hypothetical protein RhiJN_19448 [Ceratobasidium sp. AG-Ba]|nr:hypothetical protein RhiJN_19448 [Ceratobasidium sp. AG-Ba]
MSEILADSKYSPAAVVGEDESQSHAELHIPNPTMTNLLPTRQAKMGHPKTTLAHLLPQRLLLNTDSQLSNANITKAHPMLPPPVMSS